MGHPFVGRCVVWLRLNTKTLRHEEVVAGFVLFAFGLETGCCWG
jgi:hypothetical protein